MRLRAAFVLFADVTCIFAMALHVLGAEETADRAPDWFPVWIKADATPVQVDDGNVFRLDLGARVLCVQAKGDRLRVRKCGWDETVQEGWMKASDALDVYSAHQFFSELVEQQPKDARAYLARFSVEEFSPLGSKGRASDLDTAVQLAPDCAAAYAMRGDLHYFAGRYKEALADYNKLVHLEPKLGSAYLSRGRCLADMGKDEEAVDDYTKAISWMRPRFDLYKARAKLLLRIGEPNRALADITEAERLDAVLTGYGLRLDSLLALGKYEQVLRETNSAIRKEPGLAGLFCYRAEAHARTGRYAEAVADFAKAMEMKGEGQRMEFIPEWYARFLATCPDPTVRNPNKALTLAVKACRLAGHLAPKDAYDEHSARNAEPTEFEEHWVREGWREWSCLDTLAAAYAANGDFDKAVRWQKKAIEVAPKRIQDDLRSRLQLYENRQPFRLKPARTQ